MPESPAGNGVGPPDTAPPPHQPSSRWSRKHGPWCGRPSHGTSPSVAVTRESRGSNSQGSPHTYGFTARAMDSRSEEHTSELQSRFDLVCRLLLEKKKKQ